MPGALLLLPGAIFPLPGELTQFNTEEDDDEFVDIATIDDVFRARHLRASRLGPRPALTTQIGLRRLEGTVDTYQPGTLPPRLYQRNPFLMQRKDNETGGETYELTA
jgi:hypothetical protein